MPTRPTLLLSFHWHIDALRRGAQRRCMEAGYAVGMLTHDTLNSWSATNYAGILGRFPPDKRHPIRVFAENSPHPVLELSHDYPENTRWLRFTEDGEAVGTLAAEYLKRRPVGSFVFVQGTGAAHETRWRAFQRVLKADPRPCHRYKINAPNPQSTPFTLPDYEGEPERLGEFLRQTPGPPGVFGSTDHWAGVAIEAGRLAGMIPPKDFLVLGYGNREFLSQLTHPPISAIDMDWETFAYEAAGVLLDAIRGASPGNFAKVFPPGPIIERESSEGEVIDQCFCEKAVAIMKSTPNAPISLPQLAAQLGVSRSTLVRVFPKKWGCSVGQKYIEIRINLAKSLMKSGRNATAVFRDVGFDSYQGFAKSFKKQVGCSPREWPAGDVGRTSSTPAAG